MTPRTIALALVVGRLAWLPAAPAAQEARQAPAAIIELGTLGHDVSVAFAVNDKRQVVGFIADNFVEFRGAFLWEEGVMRQLSAPDLQFLEARDINDRGAIVGFGTDVTTFELVAVRWEEGIATRLPAPPGDLHCTAEAINSRGDVVGSCGTPVATGFRFHGVLWRDGEVVDLGSMPGAGEATPLAINDRGVVLGFFQTPPPEGLNAGSFVWKDGVFTRLPGAVMAADINDRSQIAGRRQLVPDLRFEAIVLDRGTIIALPSLSIPFVVTCSAEAINQRGDVAGGCSNFGTVWIRGQPRALPGLADFVGIVTDLNDRGDVVGYATAADGNYHAVLWPRAAAHGPRNNLGPAVEEIR